MAARNIRLVLVYARFNLAAAMEYRASFLFQCLGMALNDVFLIFFWWVYFDRFPSIEGWQLGDVVTLFGVVAASLGLSVTIFGNCTRLATLVVQGDLDFYLPMPRNVLLHLLISRMSLSGWGDFFFGVGALLFIGVSRDFWFFPLALVLVLLSASVYVGFAVLMGSLAFFIGNAENASRQAIDAVTHFALYPAPIFRGWLRLALLTAIPAGFVGHVPVSILRDFDPVWLGAFLGFAGVLWAIALLVFNAGLRRYESGNLVGMRS